MGSFVNPIHMLSSDLATGVADGRQQRDVGYVSPRPRRLQVLVLLTDGRVDAFQAHEAMGMAERLADEQGPASLHGFGVGRGVDKVPLCMLLYLRCHQRLAPCLRNAGSIQPTA